MSDPGETKARRVLVTQLYENGLRRKEIVAQTGFTENQVKALLTRIRHKKDNTERDTMRAARREMVINAYKEMGDTVSLSEIARMLGVSKGSVCGILTRTRGIRNSRGTLRDKWGAKAEEVRVLCANSVPDSEIAKRLGFPSANAVQAFRKRRGIIGPRTKKGKPQKPYELRPKIVWQKPLPAFNMALFDIAAKSESVRLFDEPPPERKVRESHAPKNEVIAPVFRVATCQYPMWGDKERTRFKEKWDAAFLWRPIGRFVVLRAQESRV